MEWKTKFCNLNGGATHTIDSGLNYPNELSDDELYILYQQIQIEAQKDGKQISAQQGQNLVEFLDSDDSKDGETTVKCDTYGDGEIF